MTPGTAMQLRSTRRIPTRFRTRVTTADETVEVTVVDVTELGAKADGLGRVPPGTPCQMHILGDSIEGIVRWAAGGSAGIGFAEKLTPRQLDVVRHRRTPRPETGRQRRGVHGFTELR